MRIKRIEIIGFKSFFDKTVLHINEPVTAVVGPNGCGKSNIIDAIRWCMGEQSAKHLRGKSMEDVIFSGSETRGAAGMAEVSLTFENVGFHHSDDFDSESDLDSDSDSDSDPDPDSDPGPGPETTAVTDFLSDPPPAIDFTQYGEVTITRRLFRDGDSDYLINKTPCRLRDITDFFLGTGIGTKAYSIIEQGRVGMIVSAKPEDRRLIIEEAAGITKFKKKKQAAERKMEQTRQNLLRVSDIIAEIEKQLGSLRRQAQKAERYKKYKAEMRDIELWSASHRWLGIQAEDRVLRAGLEETTGLRDAAQQDWEVRDAAIVAERADIAVEERRLNDLTQVVFELENRVKLGESQVEFHTREARELDDRVVAAGGEIDGLRRQMEETEAELARVGEDAERLDGEAAARGDELARLEEALRMARGALAEAQGELDEARAEIGRAQADIARHENQQRSLERRQGDLDLRAGRLREEESRAAARHDELVAEIAGQEDALGSLRQLHLDLGQKKEELQARLDELREQHGHNEAEVETLRTELHRRQARLKSLREIQDRYEGFARGTRAVMQHRPGGADRIRGLVADIVQAPAEYEPAVEAVLGDRLGSILVDSQQVGVEAISFLKQRAEGRSTFIPVGALSGGSAGGIEVVEATEGVRGPMLGFIDCKPEYAPVADYLFHDVLVVDSLARALELWEQGLRRTMVTLDGDIVDRHGVVTGGSREQAGAGVLQQKREIRELEEISAALEQDLADATARHVACKAELARVGATLDAIRKDTHQGEITILSHEKDLSRGKHEAERLAERRAQLERERTEVEAALAETARETEENVAALDGARGRADDAERRQLGLIEGVTVARGGVDDATGAVTECKVRVAQVGAERTAVKAQLARLQAGVAELVRRLAKLESEVIDGKGRAAQLRAEADRTAEELVVLRRDRRAAAEELAGGRDGYEQRMAALQVAEVEARSVRLEAQRLAAEASRLELRLSGLEADLRHLEESMSERYRVLLRRELFDHHLRPAVGDPEEARLRELRELIDRMGEINLTAIEEFEELSKRYDLLTGQKQDLDGALDQLEKAIGKINRTSRKRFRETFEAVNAKFQEVFPRLFRGGRAELRLTGGGDTDLLDAGVEIIAQPPGKKISTVEVLSGGEKALTAVSLIFSIFLYKPSPFCILDEVDAPLDEANVGRYNDLVREMTSSSQFIVITHNKRTMEIADSLYGVTMEEPGCSKLVGVNLRHFEKAA